MKSKQMRETDYVVHPSRFHRENLVGYGRGDAVHGNERRTRRGLTLVEVLVALVLLTVGLFGVVDLYMHQARRLAAARDEEQALSLAYDYLGQLQMAGYQALDEAIRQKASPPEADEVTLFLFPKGSDQIPRFNWNAQLKREKVGHISCVRIVVNVHRVTPVSSVEEGGGRAGVKKEVVGYAVAP